MPKPWTFNKNTKPNKSTIHLRPNPKILKALVRKNKDSKDIKRKEWVHVPQQVPFGKSQAKARQEVMY